MMEEADREIKREKVCRAEHDRRLYPPTSCVHEVCINYAILATRFFPFIVFAHRIMAFLFPLVRSSLSFHSFFVILFNTGRTYFSLTRILIHYSCMTDFQMVF